MTKLFWIRRRARMIMSYYVFPTGSKSIRVAVAHAYEDWLQMNPGQA